MLGQEQGNAKLGRLEWRMLDQKEGDARLRRLEERLLGYKIMLGQEDQRRECQATWKIIPGQEDRRRESQAKIRGRECQVRKDVKYVSLGRLRRQYKLGQEDSGRLEKNRRQCKVRNTLKTIQFKTRKKMERLQEQEAYKRSINLYTPANATSPCFLLSALPQLFARHHYQHT